MYDREAPSCTSPVSIRAEFRWEFPPFRRMGRLKLFQLAQQSRRTPAHVQLFEQFLLQAGLQRQGEAEDVAEHSQGDVALQELPGLIDSPTLRLQNRKQ